MNIILWCLVVMYAMLFTVLAKIGVASYTYLTNVKPYVKRNRYSHLQYYDYFTTHVKGKKLVLVDNKVYMVDKDNDYHYHDDNGQIQSFSTAKIKMFNDRLAMCQSDQERINYISEYARNN